jgi:hypothetical protein
VIIVIYYLGLVYVIYLCIPHFPYALTISSGSSEYIKVRRGYESLWPTTGSILPDVVGVSPMLVKILLSFRPDVWSVHADISYTSWVFTSPKNNVYSQNGHQGPTAYYFIHPLSGYRPPDVTDDCQVSGPGIRQPGRVTASRLPRPDEGRGQRTRAQTPR